MKNKIAKIGLAGLIMVFPLLLAAQNESIFYKIIHPKTKAESYILGTFHTYPEGWYEIPHEVKETIKLTDKLILEVGNSIPKRYKRKINRATRFRRGRTVIDELDGNSKVRFEQYVKENIRGTQSEKMVTLNRKPFFMYGRLFSLRFSDQVMSMEQQLGELATKNSLPIYDLEPDKRRILKYYKKYANSMLSYENLDTLTELKIQSMAKLFAQYLDGDIKAMQITYGEPDENAIDRNKYWAPQLVEMLESPSFVAVGTGHLMGEMAVQELLKKQGFIVEPIKLVHPRPEALNNYIEMLSLD